MSSNSLVETNLSNLKLLRKKYLEASTEAYKNKSKEFSFLWDRFMIHNKAYIVFTEFPIIYKYYLEYINDPLNKEKEEVYSTYYNLGISTLKSIG